MKDKIRANLLKAYEEKGLDYAISLSHSILKATKYKNDKSFRSTLHGEIAEVILEIKVIDYIKRNNITDWRMAKGLVLKDPNRANENFSTECDITLFTPQAVLMFECKSYAGNIELRGEGTLYRDGKKRHNVYKQNMLHKGVLWENICTASVDKNPDSIKLSIFNDAVGTTIDNRTNEFKYKMPLIRLDKVDTYLDMVRRTSTIRWKMDRINRILDIIEKHNSKRFDSHVKYVKSLHG